MATTDASSQGPVDPPADTSILFLGIDSVQGTARNTAVTGDYQTVGSESSLLLQLCADFETLSDSTDITQSASVGVGLFGVSEKVRFVKNTQRTTWSLNLMIRSTKVSGTHMATHYRLNDGIAVPQTDEERVDFFKQYGDSFISSLTVGAEYIAIFTIFLNSESEHQSVMTEVSAHGLMSAFSFDAGLQSNLTSFFQKIKARVVLKQKTFGVDSIELPGIESMIEFARKFPTITVDKPSIIRFSTTGYENLLPGRSFETIAANRNYLVGTGYSEGIYSDRARVQDLISQLESINAIHETYGFSDPRMEEVKDKATADLKALDGQMTGFGNDPLASFTKPALPSLAEGLPSVSFESGQSEAWGGNNVAPFDDVGKVGDFIGKCARISSIKFHTGEFVTALIVTYQGVDEATGLRKVHGGEDHTAGYELFLENGDRIVEVSGEAGVYVDQMTVRTAAKHSTAGGVPHGASPFGWTAEAGQVLLGFRGRSGAFLDQIQVVWVKLLPTVWKPRF
ncbi:hypothetical protein HL658_25435 [Azospirillum sp. RWY-5-1]|uniref:Jacalin-type lectin domain-containing protein n=1 Tax=Azospirillum oleiclasticum TaxID=2735135 RepID=A0ABX2TGY4_9PROT|nr:hypothetical protein [Azospirillum oleiclasticum]NYZ15897.1 hypothetical protein [Azospirillum oleiclasticum]NYZ23624.1 hypothetical protein [Azospirillum oleiclasticum]